MSSVRARFAPSPTGNLHVGGARTALFSYLYARHHGGVFVLRIEDTDLQRNSAESLEGIISALQWLGLEWDEGPFLQSERLAIYREQVDKLLAQGRAYKCYCSPEELQRMREERLQRGAPPRYDQRCWHLTAQERQEREEAGTPYVIRFRAESEGETIIPDRVRGEVRFDNQQVDDFVIVKSDGMPTYQLAVVVDDALMGITDVIRGEEHLSNTPKQVQLYRALGFVPPRFAHIPLILAEDRSKLSKRHGAVWVGQFEADGYLPEALVNYLALLGWAYDDKTEIFNSEELIRAFDLDGVSKNPAIFDYEKLLWMNGLYIRALTPAELGERLYTRLKGIVPDEMSASEKARLERILALIQPRMRTLNEAPDQVRTFYADSVAYDEASVRKFFGREYVPGLFAGLLEAFVSLDPFAEDAIERVFQEIRERLDMKLGDIIQPVRVAVTGSTVSPPMYETLAVLGRAKTCERLRAAAAYIKRNPQR